MAKTDKTAPFWVKLRRGDLATKESHDHRDGICNLKRERPIDFQPGRCHIDFHYTGTNVCCCRMCHGDWNRSPTQRRRRNRHRAQRETRTLAHTY